MDSIEFRDIKGYEGIYQVSEYGHILLITKRSGTLKAGQLMKPQINYLGYVTIRLTRGEDRKTLTVHSLVAKMFIGERPAGLEINHIDGDKTNNHYSNLEYVTHQENVTHSVVNKLWRPKTGIHHGMARLTEELVREIRFRYENEDIWQKDLAKEYRISRIQMSRIINRKSWKHI